MKNAIRSLTQNPGFTITVILTLALGCAANVLIFSILHAVLLRPLPFKEPHRLITLFRTSSESGQVETLPYWSFPKFRIAQEQSRNLDLAAFFQMALPLTGTDNTERLQIEFVTPNYFTLLGIQTALGRTFANIDDQSNVVLIDYELWQRRFKGEQSVIGKTLQLDRKVLTVIGVLPKKFHGQSGTAQVWVPMKLIPGFTFPRRLERAYAHWHEVIGRLKPGTNEQAAQADLKILAGRINAAFPNDPGIAPDGLSIIPLQKANLDPRLKDSLVLLFAAVGLVLLIACVNVANMILARSISRKKEIGIRVALGASRSRILQLLLTEASILSLISGVLAILFAVWGADVLQNWLPESQSGPGFHPFRLFSGVDPLEFPVIAFAVLLSFLTAILVALPAALRLSQENVSDTLKNGIGDPNQLPAHTYARLLVSSEVALSLVLLVCAGLMISSFWKLQTTALGVQTGQLLTLKIDYPRDYDSIKFQETLLRTLSGSAGIDSIAIASTTPISGNYGQTRVTIAGRPEVKPEDRPVVGFHIVSNSYFQTLRVPLIRGRNFSQQDRENAPRVAIINQTAASKLWPNENPIGQRIKLGLGWEPPNDFAEVIAIAGDVKYETTEALSTPDVYLNYMQPTGELSPFVIVKSSVNLKALTNDLRAAIKRIDPNLPVYDIKTMNARIGDANSGVRFVTLILGAFATLALSLAAIGIFAVTSYTVSGRKKEIAIRIALGASQYSAISHTIRDIGIYVIAGSTAGLLMALLTSRLFRTFLFHVMPNDPFTIVISAALLIGVAFLACYLPARRATRIDPMKILKYE